VMLTPRTQPEVRSTKTAQSFGSKHNRPSGFDLAE
jgi:hypothetical protein